MPSMALAWAPPSHNGPIQSPLRETAPSLTACVRRALDTKGGVSRFSAHFTSIHQKRNKSLPPVPRAGQRLASAIPTKTIPIKTTTFLWWGEDHIVSGSLCRRGSWLFLPSSQDICIKMGFFCLLRRAKRKLGGGGGHEGKERKGFQYKGQEGQ